LCLTVYMFNECVWRAIGKEEFGMSEF
jgi:hypothetical protein